MEVPVIRKNKNMTRSERKQQLGINGAPGARFRATHPPLGYAPSADFRRRAPRRRVARRAGAWRACGALCSALCCTLSIESLIFLNWSEGGTRSVGPEREVSKVLIFKVFWKVVVAS